ncbi:XRE family transcriptional regulator [Staphylococcus equorum]|uniref:XRE family transcriptional regulator n=1 Tax=Staphylococcus equorum TaxID=246432 RepID=A0AAW7AMN2_9STAP|nr:XRE family transcriptional regulator [Staphylococcus equorum]MDK9866760.1 XRE family transcriptional regulator [Staphylococcus equorum]QPT00134.1 XRE family transcriptional regulator [Staphylococcus equorum]
MLESRFNTEATQRVTDSINELLGPSQVTAYEIQAQTGVQRSLIGKLRKGQVKLGNIAFKNALKLYAYSEEIKKA